jgi:hypothetical protein
MTSSAEIVRILELVAWIGSGLAAIRLGWTGLYRRYRILFAYLIFRFLNLALIIFWFTDNRSPGYQKEWVITQPLWWLLSVLVVLELYSLVLEKYKGLATLGRWFQYAGLAISIGISAATLLPKIQSAQAQQSAVLGYYYAIERGVGCSMLLFLLLMVVWLTRYPVPLSRNVIFHTFVYSIFFLSSTLVALLRSFFGLQLSQQLNTALLGLFAACMLAWFLGLSARGEEIRVSIPRFGPEQEERILRQLDALNSTLLKVSRN